MNARSTAVPAASRSRAEVPRARAGEARRRCLRGIRKRTVAVSTIVRSARVSGSNGEATAHEPVDGSPGLGSLRDDAP